METWWEWLTCGVVQWMDTSSSEGTGRKEIHEKGNLKDAGKGCPYMPKDKSVGKKAGLAEHGVFTRTQA